MPSPLHHAIYNSALPFTSCSLRALKSGRGEISGPSQVLPEYGDSRNSPGHACGLLSSWECLKAFQSPYGYLIPQFFLASLLPSLLFLQPWLTPSVGCQADFSPLTHTKGISMSLILSIWSDAAHKVLLLVSKFSVYKDQKVSFILSCTYVFPSSSSCIHSHRN